MFFKHLLRKIVAYDCSNCGHICSHNKVFPIHKRICIHSYKTNENCYEKTLNMSRIPHWLKKMIRPYIPKCVLNSCLRMNNGLSACSISLVEENACCLIAENFIWNLNLSIYYFDCRNFFLTRIPYVYLLLIVNFILYFLNIDSMSSL